MMKLSKTRIALAVSLSVGLPSYADAAWWDGGDYTTRRTSNGTNVTITGDLNITVKNDFGLYLTDNANVKSGNVHLKIDVNDVITELGYGKYGIYAEYSKLDLSNAASVTITNNGEFSTGVKALFNSHFKFGDNVTVHQTNDSDTYDYYQASNTIAAEYYSSITFGNNNILSANAIGARALFALGFSTISVGDNNTLITYGASGYGVHLVADSNITLGNNNLITTYGDGSAGVHSEAGSYLSVGNNNIITTYGNINENSDSFLDRASAIAARMAGNAEVGSGNIITTYGEKAYGIDAGEESSVTLKDGNTIGTFGKDAIAVFANDGSTITFEGNQTIYSADSYALYAGSWDSKITADGMMNVTGDIGSFGATVLVDLIFHEGSYLKGTSFAESGVATPENYAGTLNMDMTGSRWDLTGTSHVTSLTLADSYIDFNQTALPSTHLNIANLEGNSGSIGGIFYMHSFVETGDIINGGSGENITDKLIVTGAGSANGDHKVVVADRSDAITNGTETITIIETAGGNLNFTMDAYNEQGAYLYGLREVESTESGIRNWELYGTGILANTPKTVVDIIGARYRLGLQENQTLLQRLGDLRQSPDEYGAWVKLHGGDIRGKNTAMTAGYDLDYFGVQLGVDKKLLDDWLDGEVYFGLWSGYTKGNADYYSTHTGDIKNYFVGLYATYMDKTNTYTDLVLKYGKQKSHIDGYSTQGIRADGSDRTDMYSASLEVGRRFHFERNQLDEGFYFEPQAQLSLTHFGSGDMHFGSGLRVKNDSFDSLVGRVGVNIGIERKYHDTPYNAYVKVSYLKEFDSDVSVSFNNAAPEKVDFGDDWWTYGVGVTAKLADRHSIYMDIERSSSADLFKQSWGGNIGYRYEF